MPLSPEQEIAYRMQRRTEKFRVLGVFVGVLSAILIVGAVVLATYRKMQNKPQLEWDYVEKLYGEDGQGVPVQKLSEPEVDGGVVDFSKRSNIGEEVDVVDMTAPRMERAAEALAAGRLGGIENIEGKQKAIAEVVKEFFSADSISKLLPLVRDARRVRPLMESYYATHPLKPAAWKGVGWAMPVEEPGYQFAYVQALFEHAPPVHVVVEETDIGFLVDWESSVHYSEVGWKDFQKSRPGEPKTFRLLASRVDDSGPSSSRQPVALLKLKHPAEDGVIFGRFDPGDPRFRPLVEQLDLCQWKDVPVTLRLCYPGPSAPANEVDIAGVEGKGWLFLQRTRS